MSSVPGPEELQAWFEAHAGHVYCHLRARLSPAMRGSCDVEDLLQEVFLRATKVKVDGPVQDPRAWLLSIARFVVMEVLRSVRHRPQSIGTGTTATRFDLPDSVTSLTRRVARDELRAQFFAALDDLAFDERQLVVQHGLEGRSLASVAERLGIGTEAAYKRWQRLRARLRELGSPADLL